MPTLRPTRFLFSESGDEVIEYGLLASIIGLAGVLLFPGILEGLSTAFQGWHIDINALWVPRNPQ